MANYSKDNERQNKALKSILRGETPEKRIFVAQEDLEFKKKVKKEAQEEQKRIDEKLEATKGARMPWFCPECKKVMKKRLDDKMYRLHNQCFDCQIKFEAKLRAEGKYENWEKQKVLRNKLSWINEQVQGVEDWREQSVKPIEAHNSVGVNEIEIEREKWNVDVDNINKMADEALEEFEKMRIDAQKELESVET